MFKELFIESYNKKDIVESNDFSKIIDVIKKFSTFGNWTGVEDDNQYIITMFSKKGKSLVIVFDKNFVKIDSLDLIVTKPKNGIVQLSKAFAEKTKDDEDYYILMDRLSTIYNRA